MGNTLEVDAGSAPWQNGTGLLSDVVADFQDLGSGNVASGLLDGSATAIDAASFYEDPLGALLSMGAGWLMDHIEPLKGWLNQLTGDPEEVKAHAATWENVAGRLKSTGDQFRSDVASDLGSMSGDAIEHYRAWAEFHLKSIETATQGGEAVAAALKNAGLFVEVVHGVVRDLISQLVGHIGSWIAEEAFSLGTATAWVVDQVVEEVANLANKGRTWIKDLIESCDKLKAILTKVKPALTKLKGVLHDAEPKAGRHAGTGKPSHVGGDKAGHPGERRPITQPRYEPEHAKGALPSDHDPDKTLGENAKQFLKNLPHYMVKDGHDDLKTEPRLVLANANREDSEEE